MLFMTLAKDDEIEIVMPDGKTMKVRIVSVRKTNRCRIGFDGPHRVERAERGAKFYGKYAVTRSSER